MGTLLLRVKVSVCFNWKSVLSYIVLTGKNYLGKVVFLDNFVEVKKYSVSTAVGHTVLVSLKSVINPFLAESRRTYGTTSINEVSFHFWTLLRLGGGSYKSMLEMWLMVWWLYHWQERHSQRRRKVDILILMLP